MKTFFKLSPSDYPLVTQVLSIAPDLFREIYVPILRRLRLKKYKIFCDLDKNEFDYIASNLKIAKDITDHLISNLDFNLDSYAQDALKESISRYIFTNSIFKAYRALALPLINYVKRSKSVSPLKSWIHKNSPVLEREEFSYLDELAFSKFEIILKTYLNSREDSSDKKMGRPSSVIQDLFMQELKQIIKREYPNHFKPKIDAINSFLRTNYNSFFDELPVSIPAIKQAIERAEKLNSQWISTNQSGI